MFSEVGGVYEGQEGKQFGIGETSLGGHQVLKRVRYFLVTRHCSLWPESELPSGINP